MLALDHVFAFVDPGEAAQAAARAESAGWVLDAGIEHDGQGTRNRRLWFDEQYLELLWLSSRADAAANPLHLDRRADWRTTGACPFGLGLRGQLDDATRAEFWPYYPPYAPGACIWIHRSNETAPAQPFVFAMEAPPEVVERYLPRNRHAATPHLLDHGRPAAIREVHVACAEPPPPLLDRVAPPITWRRAAAPHLAIVVGDRDGALELTATFALRG